MRAALTSLRGRYDRLVIPCAGRFTIAEAAIDAGWQPGQIEASDLSLFSAVLGYECAGRPKAELKVEFHDWLEPLQPFLEDRFAGTVLFGLKLCQMRGRNLYEKQVRDELWLRREICAGELQEKVVALKARIGGLKYENADLFETVNAARSDGRAVLYVDPPTFSKGYTKMFDTRGLITWGEPKFAEFDPKTCWPRLYDLSLAAPALIYLFRGPDLERGLAEITSMG